MKTYLVKEIFGPTIQGEGTHAGKVVSFLRFGGCNKWNGKKESKPDSICNFCDTEFVGGERMTIDEIINKLLAIGISTVVISGGEPALQVDQELLNQLYVNHFDIHIETNGSVDISKVEHYFKHITCSPKQSIKETKLRNCDDLKILYPYINEDITIAKFRRMSHLKGYLQPVMPNDLNGKENLKATIEKLYENPLWKLSMQMHKIIEVE